MRNRLVLSGDPITGLKSSRVLGAIAAALLLVGLLPAGVAVASTPTTTTLTISNLAPHRGDMVDYTVDVAPAPGGVGYMWIETSADGVTWAVYQTATAWSSAGRITASVQVWHNEPLGPRFVRASYQGTTEFDGSTSGQLVQTISRRSPQFNGLNVFSPNGYAALVPDSLVGVSASVSGSGGTLVFEELDGPDWVELGRTTVPYQSIGGTGGAVYVNGFPLGSHTVRARLLEDELTEPGTSDLFTFEITKAPSNPTVEGPDPVQANHPINLLTKLVPPSTGVIPNGTLTLTDVDTGEILGTTTGPSPYINSSLPARPLGTYHLVAAFTGDGNFLAQTGTAFAVHVVSDVVETTGVGVNSSTFYPIKDGYRDLESVKGFRYETASVAIRIYSPTRRLVRSAQVPAGLGAYSYAWNGRTGTKVLAAGRYKVVQTLSDTAGTKLTVTSYVNLSHKRLVSKTAYVTKNGNLISAKGTSGSAHVTVSSGGRYAKLSTTGGDAAVGYQLTLPTAVTYNSISFQIYTKAYFSAPSSQIGVQNFVTCPYGPAWAVGCFDRWRGFGFERGGPGWASTSASIVNNRHGKIVRGTALVPYGTVYIYKVRLRVVYKVLR